jgi:GNAT superfamily N-acetyltransferase
MEIKRFTIGCSMDTKIIVRKAKLDDALFISALSSELGYSASVDEIRDRLSRILASDEHTVFVASSSDEIVHGWIHIFISKQLVTETFAELGGLIVANEYRRQGIGEQLLLQAEEWAREKELCLMRIRTQIFRKEAHRFYEKMEYSFWKEQKAFEKRL